MRDGATSRTLLHIDWTRCDGRGTCTELLPELLVEDPWGYPRALDGSPEPRVPKALEQHARAAVEACPLRALALRPAPPPASTR